MLIKEYSAYVIKLTALKLQLLHAGSERLSLKTHALFDFSVSKQE